MASILITGCSRGIGLELVKQILNHATPPALLIATCRKPEDAKDLQALSTIHKNLHILKLDVNNFDGFGEFANQVKDLVGDRGLTILINNAGIMKLRGDAVLNDANASGLIDTLSTNFIAPLMITKALRPLLKKAADNNKNSPVGWSRSAVINMSSMLGSISNNTTGGFWGYRESKAAINMSTRSLALELGAEGILVMSMHPGWVKTDLGTSAATLTVQDSVRGMLRVIYSLGPQQQGSFYQWDGKVVTW